MSAVSRLINDVEPSRTSTCLKRCTTSRRAETFYRKSARTFESADQTRIDRIPRRSCAPPFDNARNLNFVFDDCAVVELFRRNEPADMNNWSGIVNNDKEVSTRGAEGKLKFARVYGRNSVIPAASVADLPSPKTTVN